MARSRTAFALVAVVAPLVVFGALAQAVSGGGEFTLDGELVGLSEDFYEHETAWEASKAALYASIGAGAAVALGVLALLLRRRLLRPALFWTLAVGGVLVLDPVLKALVRRPGIGSSRDEWSFPSGNAMASLAIALALVLLLRRSRWRLPAAALGALVVALEGAGVVALGWHYASDVAGGWCVAAAWVTLVWLVVARYPRPRPAS